MNAVQLLCSLTLILVASFRIFAQVPGIPLKEQVNTDEGTICVYERGEHREKIVIPVGQACPKISSNKNH
ncbi:hypothetical protein [Enterobacter kobei]|uniref:Secreted protein n=2 Tax=Enterobacter kobei TaxID=208224 RepID=A0AA86M884_9ENTR|nr:hypothetical protein [Enterobacter kobei]OLR20978.1 hypothetical protein BH713_10135 [Enterobacter kobei]BCU55693.1 hypothetical protein ENKO_22870 [Enterobacter kobei]SIQ76750.1 hypothetical protein SAMN05444841_10213 [Enterobacter kobei]